MSANKHRKIYFEISERKIFLRIIDLIVIFAGIFFTEYIFKLEYVNFDTNSYYWIAVLSIYVSLLGTIFGMYHLPTTTNFLQITKGVVLTVSTTVVLFLLTPIFTPPLPQNRIQIIYFYIALLFSLWLWRWFYLKFFATHRFVKKAILICNENEFEQLAAPLEKSDPHFKFIGFLDTANKNALCKKYPYSADSPQEELGDFIFNNGVSEIIISPNANVKSIHFELLELMELGIATKDYLFACESISYKIPVDLIENDFYKHFSLNRNNSNKLYQYFVRGIEVFSSIFGLVISAVFIMPFVVIGNLIGNKGGLFYTQERIGKNGKPFNIYKFRTMVKDAEKEGAVFAQKNDARITPFGKFLRKSRIDELPQLINVLKGEMSIIGPRPERAFFVDQITEAVSFYPTRHIIKPGLTGWAQINYSYGDSIEDSVEKLKYDLFYIKHRGPLLDFNIVIKTIGTVLFYRGQ
ncbi:MAG TPA: sugar transferase [Flavobacterium sp.]|nr:sugar transferase [Flavobacterium sp.]